MKAQKKPSIGEARSAHPEKPSQNATYQDLFERMLDPVLLVDMDFWTIVDMNFSAEKHFGKNSDQLLGTALLDLVTEADRKEFSKALRITSRRYYPRQIEIHFLDGKGGSGFMEVGLCGLKLADGSHVIQVVARDVTQIREAQKQLVQLTRMAALGEMAGGIAHEINNPLMIIANATEILQQIVQTRPLESTRLAKLGQVSETIERTVTRIEKIVRGLKTFSRSGVEISQEPFEKTKISKIVSDTLIFCKEKFAVHDVQLKFGEFSQDLNVECWPTQISQVLLNLLGNAFDAVVDLEEKWVEVQFLSTGDWLDIVVTDSGKGIPQSVRDKIFQPFYTTKDVGKGTGLGLSISRGIVEAHSGQMLFDERCKNTRFIVRLPKEQKEISQAESKKTVSGMAPALLADPLRAHSGDGSNRSDS